MIQELHEKHGPVIRVGPNELSFSSPRTFHQVYVIKASEFRKSHFYDSIQPGIGPKYAGLFNHSDHREAMAERKDLQPAFSSSAMKEYEERYDKLLDILLDRIKELGEVDLFRYL